MGIEQYEFGSLGWLAALKAIIEKAFADSPIAGPWSLCAVYLNPPEHLRPPNGNALTWYCRVLDGNVEVAPGEIDSDRKYILEYETALPLGRAVISESPEAATRAQEIITSLVDEGKIRYEIKPRGEKIPAFMTGVHDAIAQHTA